MSAPVTPHFLLRILGPVTVTTAAAPVDLTGRAAAAAAYLASPPRLPRHATVLAGALWPDTAPERNSVQKLLSGVKGSGLPLKSRDGFYQLDLTDEQVDAGYFIAQARDDAALAADPARLDVLLGLWTADPAAVHEKYLTADVWGPLKRAWRSVVDVVRDADSDFRAQLTNLAGFRQLFPGNPLMKELLPRKRLLIVDDEHADLISAQLGPRYEYKKITSYKDWSDLVNSGPLEFDGAIVDRCLFPRSDDETGLAILEHLHANYRDRIPRILISAQLGGAQRQLVERYGLFDTFGKLRGRELTGLLGAVEEMLDRPAQR